MKNNELKSLDDVLKSLKNKDINDTYNYEGYGVLDNLELSRDDLKKAIDIFWEIIMVMDLKQREGKYLFSKGLINSKDIFISQKNKMESITGNRKDVFNLKAEIFRERLENVKPAVKFLIKIKELL